MVGLNNHILVPIDFSEQSFIALEQSYNLARLTLADITLINVIEEPFQLPFISKSEDTELESKIKKELDKLASETMKKFNVRINTMVSHGKVYEEIQKAAQSLKTTFIIMGTNGSSGIKKFIGSNALRVIRESPCIVITIKGKEHRFGCKNIILPLDLTRETREKVTTAIEIAKLFNSTIHLVSVQSTDDEFLVNKLHRQMNQVNDFIKEHEVNCTVKFLQSDDIASSVLMYSKEIDADLIMIMTQEENWTDFMFIGSSAQEIINTSDIPVLSIRPKEKKTNLISAFEY